MLKIQIIVIKIILWIGVAAMMGVAVID